MNIISFEEFKNIFLGEGLEINKSQYEMLDKYANMLVEYNKVMNLTGITDPMGISEKHFLDSLLIFKYCNIPRNAKVIDVGTGAGFPGVPMKIYRPDIQVTLLDSLMKRVKFLEEVSKNTLDMECIHSRAEDGGHSEMLREKYDAAAARAVAALPVLAEYCMPYVKVGGIFIAMKGPNENIDEGKSAVEVLGGKISDIFEYSLPCGDKRVIIVIKKISDTPTKYPRTGSQISKKHL